ncbi:MAG TPA: flagellar export chaperone FliS [Phycisphaerales bacterium]|nr:flagellar export chaperone FliS [Phycisphaerales bacterium]
MDRTAAYEETTVMTQDRGRLIVMLYEGAIKFLRQALAACEQGDYEKKGRLICRAQDIIFELNTVLDVEAGGDIAQNLRKLYNFMWRHLGQANAAHDTDKIREVIGLLETLNRGWRAVAGPQGPTG